MIRFLLAPEPGIEAIASGILWLVVGGSILAIVVTR